MRVGLVLGAGGSVGVAYHGAVLAAIEEVTGWDPRQAAVMIGTSAGSISSAVLRAGVPASDLARISEGDPLSEEGARLAALGRPHRPRPGLADLLNFRPMADPKGVLHGLTHPWAHPLRGTVVAALPGGGIPTTAISDGINAVFSGRWPDEALWICAFDLRRGRRVVFGRAGAPPAPVGSAVAASAAIPVYFEPVRIGDRSYVDGGVRSMVNLDLCRDADLDLVIVSSPLSQASPHPALAPDTFMRQPLRARLRAELADLRSTGVPVVAIQPNRAVARAMGLNPMDARRRREVSRAARVAARKWLTEGMEGRRLAELLAREAAATASRPKVVDAGGARAKRVLMRRPGA